MPLDNRNAIPEPGNENKEKKPDEPQILKEIIVEELSIDGICGVY